VTLAFTPAAAQIDSATTALSRPDIFNGDFETGDLTGWTSGGINSGFATVVHEGTCFSANDTRGITLDGTFSALIRSSGPAPINSTGILTSSPFVARSSVSFRALSENSTEIPTPVPVTFEVRLLDTAGALLQSQILQTHVVTLPFNGCIGSTPGLADGAFSQHTIDTSAYAGQLIRLEFRQHTNVNDRGFFTLVDDVQLTGAVAPVCTPPPADTVSWWTADGTARDSIGSNDGTLTNGASFAPGLVGQAFTLNGSTGGVTVPDAPSLNFGPGVNFSIDAWIRPAVRGTLSAPFGVEIQTVVDKRLAPSSLDQMIGYDLFLSNGKLGFQMSDVLRAGFGPTFINSTGPDLRDGSFHHVAVTVDRSRSNGGTLYVDGIAVLSFDPTIAPGDLSNAKPLQIGIHATAGFNGFFKGLMDEVQISNRALGVSEIETIFLAGRAGTCGTDELSDQVVSLTSQVAALTEQNAALQASLDAANAAMAQLRLQITELTEQNLALQAALEAANAQIADLTSLVDHLTSENSALQASLDAANLQIAQLQHDLASAQSTLRVANAAIAQLQSDLVAALQSSGAQETALVAAQMADLLNDLRAAFGDPRFTLPGSTPFEQLRNLVDAVMELNRGRKEGVYVNLGGRPGRP
jgi:outer membrane murein-binding lipoprotein Lpp